MVTSQEMAIRFLDYLYEHYGEVEYIKRVAPSIGPITWKLNQFTHPRLNNVRQIKFTYREHVFKVRYTHKGHLIEILETIGQKDGRTVCKIRNLDEAMEINIKDVLDGFLGV